MPVAQRDLILQVFLEAAYQFPIILDELQLGVARIKKPGVQNLAIYTPLALLKGAGRSVKRTLTGDLTRLQDFERRRGIEAEARERSL